MPDYVVRVGQQNATRVLTSASGSGGTLGGLSDVDTSTLSNGAVIVYNSTTSKWESTTTLTPGNTKNLDVNGGSF